VPCLASRGSAALCCCCWVKDAEGDGRNGGESGGKSMKEETRKEI